MPSGNVIVELAGVYPQLHLTPGEWGAREYKRIVQLGAGAPTSSLDHFLGHEDDSSEYEQTPAGTVRVITLHERRDFELFLQIMACRCVPAAIPKTQGASILDGVINWTRIRAHKEAFLRAGGAASDWNEEFRRFTADKNNFKDALIVLSWGPYSAVSADMAGLSERDWLKASHTLRKYHECTHFLCRCLFPEQIDAVWDELVADAVGLYAALGRYDLRLAELFLGVDKSGYIGGRLENYAEAGALDALARRVHRTLCRFARTVQSVGPLAPYDLAIRLEQEHEAWSDAP